MHEQPPPSPWPALVWLGTGLGIALGAILVMLIKGHARAQAQPAQTLPAGNSLGGFFNFSKMPKMLPDGSSSAALGAMLGNKSVLATNTLSNTETSQLMQATSGKAWVVQVRTIGPAGAFAMFGTDSNTVAGDINATGVLAVPAGSFHDVYLQPGEMLFARGTAPNTIVSISGRLIE